MENNKHRKIAYILHSINLFLFLAGGFLIFVVSQTFVACTGSSQSAEFTCSTVLLVCFGLPLLIGITPLICLKINNKISKVALYIYSVLIALVFMPVGTAIGGHTIYYLKNLDSNA